MQPCLFYFNEKHTNHADICQGHANLVLNVTLFMTMDAQLCKLGIGPSSTKSLYSPDWFSKHGIYPAFYEHIDQKILILDMHSFLRTVFLNTCTSKYP